MKDIYQHIIEIEKGHLNRKLIQIKERHNRIMVLLYGAYLVVLIGAGGVLLLL
ncbi:hypothetical protein [Flavobacterium hungaricum]|uniref:hypothetical protein n=1 Tax=Flavobacterium hungaricum TaxID=2082725 RepID=UPI001884440E|nr:hypothetical protein [Flavobacterium hungaricum]